MPPAAPAIPDHVSGLLANHQGAGVEVSGRGHADPNHEREERRCRDRKNRGAAGGEEEGDPPAHGRAGLDKRALIG